MKSKFVEIVFILDRSGSMSGLESDTIGGFNNMLEKQKELEGKAIVSTILFDNEFKVLHNRVDIKGLKNLIHSAKLSKHHYNQQKTICIP